MKAADKKTLNAHLATIEAMFDEIDTMRTEARAAFEEKSERWQESDKGQEASEECDRLDTLADAIEAARDAFGDFELN